MANAIFRSDNMSATYNGALLKSARYYVGSTATAIQNGHVVALDGLLDGERELFKAIAPSATSERNDLYVVTTPEVMYDERKKNLNEFTNDAGSDIRLMKLEPGDAYAATAEAFDGTPKVGDYATIQAKTQIKPLTTLDSSTPEKHIGKFIAIEISGKDTYYVIQVM